MTMNERDRAVSNAGAVVWPEPSPLSSWWDLVMGLPGGGQGAGAADAYAV